jgi:glutathione synthase
MDKTLLIIGDPLGSLNSAGDSSLALAQGGIELGYRIDWTVPEQIALLNGEPLVSVRSEILSVAAGQPPIIIEKPEKSPLRLESYSKILVRKDPPFDEAYTDLCWILSQCSPQRVINSPEALLNLHEKLSPWRFAKAGIVPDHMLVPTLVSRNAEQLMNFAEEQFSVAEGFLEQFKKTNEFRDFKFQLLAKPWRGHGGRGVQTFATIKDFKTWVSGLFEQSNSKAAIVDLWIVQPLLPEIHTQGDRRVFIVNGAVAFDFVRWPAAGRIEANLAQGGSATIEQMPEEVQAVSARIAHTLKKEGVLLAGLDFIGSRLTEVNITSPTGIRTFEKLTGRNIVKKIAEDLFAD